MRRINRFVVIYDVCVKDDSQYEKRLSAIRRAKIMRILYEFGIRTQLSVFEVELNEKEHELVIRKAGKVLRRETDKFFIYPIDEKSYKSIIRLGNTEGTLINDFFL